MAISAGTTQRPNPADGRCLITARSNLGHCGECHTPRNTLGIPDLDREFAGAPLGDGEVEAIDAAALAQWTEDDFVLLLSLGLKPDGEFIGGEMEKVVEHNTSKLTKKDQQAIAAFFKRRQPNLLEAPSSVSSLNVSWQFPQAPPNARTPPMVAV